MKAQSKCDSRSVIKLMLLLPCLWLSGCDGGGFVSTGAGIVGAARNLEDYSLDFDIQFLTSCTNGGILYGSFFDHQCPSGWTEVDPAEFPELVCNPPGPFSPAGPSLGFHVDAVECPAGWTEFDLTQFIPTQPPS